MFIVNFFLRQFFYLNNLFVAYQSIVVFYLIKEEKGEIWESKGDVVKVENYIWLKYISIKYRDIKKQLSRSVIGYLQFLVKKV